MTAIGWTGVGAIGIGILALGFGVFLRPGEITDPARGALNHWQNLFTLAPILGGTVLILLGSTMVARSLGNVFLVQAGVALALVLVGGGIIAFIHLVLAGPEQTRSWPRTEGTILEQYVPPIVQGQGMGTKREMARIRYQYRVAGQTFTSDRVLFSGGRATAAYNSQVSQLYPAGARVEVYYNPKAPGEAVLDHQPVNTVLKVIGYLAGANFILGGIGAWFLIGRFMGK